MSRKTIQKNLAYDSDRQRFYVTRQQNGTRTTKTYRSYHAAAAALAADMPRPPDSRFHPAQPTTDMTLGQWLNWWLVNDVTATRAESTAYGYRNIIRCHLLPELGAAGLQTLTPLMLQTYLYGRLGHGLSPNSVIKHYTLLHTALRRAVQLGLLKKDPSDAVIPPRKDRPQHHFYSPEQLRTLFFVTQGTPLGLAVKLAAYLGLRRSEITGLRWGCVDLTAKIIQIQQVRTEVGGREVVKPPKTARSIRRLSIAGTPDLLSELEAAFRRRRSDRPDEYVLLLPDGTPPLPDLLTYQMAQVVRKNHLPKITLHGLRHSFASIANSQQIPMHDISRTLGHSSISITSNIYTHLFDDTESRTLQAVAQAIHGGNPL